MAVSDEGLQGCAKRIDRMRIYTELVKKALQSMEELNEAQTELEHHETIVRQNGKMTTSDKELKDLRTGVEEIKHKLKEALFNAEDIGKKAFEEARIAREQLPKENEGDEGAAPEGEWGSMWRAWEEGENEEKEEENEENEEENEESLSESDSDGQRVASVWRL